ncbi:fumarate hydratase [bacterium]
MRRINLNKIKDSTKSAFLEANIVLSKSTLMQIKKFHKTSNAKSKRALDMILENCAIAKHEKIPLCQDTGMAEIFAFIGQDVFIDCSSSSYNTFADAVNKGVSEAYKEGFFRKSIVTPLTRENNNKNIPAVIYTEYVKGDSIEIYAVPKGFGCENRSILKMFNPTVSSEDIVDFIFNAVKDAGPNACPPMFIGIGIGGTSEKAVLISKLALLNKSISKVTKKEKVIIEKIKKDVLKKSNTLDIGPLGFGGKPLIFDVNINTYPTHIAGLPVAVTFSCWCNRWNRIKI